MKYYDDKIIEITRKTKPPGQDWQEALEAHIKAFNINHAVVMVGGKTKVMRRTSKEAGDGGNEGIEYVAPAEMDCLYSNTTIQTGVKVDKYDNETPVYANHFKAWLTHPGSDVYRNGVLFKPSGNVPDGVFNTWQGYGCGNNKTLDWELIRGHIDGIICNHNDKLVAYFYNWVAYTFQHPEKPVRSALVLRGIKGSGKGLIGHFLRKIWGRHGLYITQSEQVTGKFNGHLADVCFLFADEAFFSGDRKHQSTLKGLVTDPIMMIERKGMEAVQQPNYLKLFIATNDDWAVPSSADERRWGVFDVSDALAGNKDYFTKLHREINDPAVQASFLADMLARDVSGWQASEIPETAGLKDQRSHSLNSIGEWLMSGLSLGQWDCYFVAFTDLYKDYLESCATRKCSCYDIKSATAVGRYLGKLYEKKRVDGLQSYIFYSNERAKETFSEVEKIEFDD